MSLQAHRLHNLSKHQKKKNLVSISRGHIDRNDINGFILDSSEKMVALQYVRDFSLDGLMFLRVDDITEVKSSAASKI